MVNKITKRKLKKHRHYIIADEECPRCGYQEGYCKKCDKVFCRDYWRDKWEGV